MIKMLLSNQPSAPLNDQREKIFHTRCDVLKNICSLIIDSVLCCNCCSTKLVEKLNFALIPHPKPYKLHWVNEDGDIKVKHQVNIKFSIRKYKDEVLCDVIPMEACHILLRRPWQFDHNTTHNGHTNEITLLQKAKKFVLHPLTPTQVASDQAQMQARREEESSMNSTLSPKSKVWNSPSSNPKVISHETLLTQKYLLNLLHEEKPSYLLLCHSSLTCISCSSLKNLTPSIVVLL